MALCRRFVPVLSEHGSRQRVGRRFIDQLQNLPVAVLRVTVDGQNRSKDFLHNTEEQVKKTNGRGGTFLSARYLLHDGVLRVPGLNDGRLHKVALPIVTAAPSDDVQVWGRLGVIQPLLDPTERLQRNRKEPLSKGRDTEDESDDATHFVIDHGREKGGEVLDGLQRRNDGLARFLPRLL